MELSDEKILEGVPKHDLRAVSRLISLSENRSPRARAIQSKLFRQSGHAQVIGITGSPGAGKSTLVDQMAFELSSQGKKVAILAIDPTSPFSGGAILGDRIRMVRSTEKSNVYVRSMATRGALGGVSRATLDAVQILDAARFDYVLIETVGVGQAEVDVVRLADTCVVVVVPGMGDSVQAFKAGILEIADLFVINKADRDGADLVHKDLRLLLSLNDMSPELWTPPILKSVATKNEGTKEILEQLQAHQQWLKGTTKGREKRLKVLEETILSLVEEVMLEKMLSTRGQLLKAKVQECFDRKSDPYTVVEELLRS